MCKADYLMKAEQCRVAAKSARNVGIMIVWMQHYYMLITKALREERNENKISLN